MRGVDVVRAVRAEALLQRVDRRGADVSKDDPECRNDEGSGGEFMEAVTVLFFHDTVMLHATSVPASERTGTGC